MDRQQFDPHTVSLLLDYGIESGITDDHTAILVRSRQQVLEDWQFRLMEMPSLLGPLLAGGYNYAWPSCTQNFSAVVALRLDADPEPDEVAIHIMALLGRAYFGRQDLNLLRT